MDRQDTDLADLRRGFAAESFVDGGVLLHLGSGDFFRLDPSGAAVWSAIFSHRSADDVAAAVASSLGIDAARAYPLIQDWIAQARGLVARLPVGIPLFEEDDRTLVLKERGEALLSYDKSACVVSVHAGREVNEEALAAALRIFVPKVFARWCRLALHASAVSVRGQGLLFSGESGAGKTTIARLLSAQNVGNRLVGEDVVMLSGPDGGLAVTDGAERIIQAWLNEAAEALLTRRGADISIDSVRRALPAIGQRLPIRKLVFLDRNRRGGSEWALRPLPRPEALETVFRHSFLYSSDPASLRSHLAACRALAAQVPTAEATAIPEGTEVLARALSAQIETIAS